MRVRDADGAELRAGALACASVDGTGAALPSAAQGAESARTASGSSCGEVHDEDDPRLGEPICPECFDYEHAVLWNALAPELWRRTAIQIPRELARLLGITRTRLRERVRVSYVKVAEYPAPRRAALPLVVRLDAAQPKDRPSCRAAAGRVHDASC